MLEAVINLQANSARDIKGGNSACPRAIPRAKQRDILRREMQAAEVTEKVRNVTQGSDPNGRAIHLTELHASGCWIWPTLVARMLGVDRTAETTRAQTVRFEMCPSRPPWRIAMPSPR